MAPKRKENLPPGIEPRRYYAPGHIATTTPRGNIKNKEKGLFRQESNPGPPMRRATSLWHWHLYIRDLARKNHSVLFRR